MSEWVNVGVSNRSDGSDIPTKAALKRAIAENPDNVVVYGTSDFSPFTGSADNLVIGTRYSVVGPNPDTSRKWYATIEKLPNGNIIVK
jgi:hypothetical protein